MSGILQLGIESKIVKPQEDLVGGRGLWDKEIK